MGESPSPSTSSPSPSTSSPSPSTSSPSTSSPSTSSPSTFNQSLEWENNVLSQKVHALKSEFSTDSARTRFANASLSFYYFLNFYLFVLYVLVGLIAMYIIFFKLPWDMSIKFLALVAVAAYPFIIGTVEYGLRYVITYLYSLITGNVYSDPYYEHQPVSLSSIFSFSSLI